MKADFVRILQHLLMGDDRHPVLPIFDPRQQFAPAGNSGESVTASLNAAFLIVLCGASHPDYPVARDFLERYSEEAEWREVAHFYRRGLREIEWEMEQQSETNPEFRPKLRELVLWLEHHSARATAEEVAEKVWRVFFPEGVGIRGREAEQIASLRRKRTVRITRPNPNPLQNPARQILFTSNVLLTVPGRPDWLEEIPLNGTLKKKLRAVLEEPQIYWYDHPIPVGVPLENNEVIYGLRGLDRALAFEKERGNMNPDDRAVCVLSLSVTHRGLHEVAREYLQEEIRRAGGFSHLEVYLFGENETRTLLETVLLPAAKHFLGSPSFPELEEVFGVDGEYGRHYSFLKAIAAFWQVFIDPQIQATFKIDLDQVFPQEDLVRETGRSALEHFTTPLWGAEGVDSNGNPVELGMIAGALVNEKDIGKSLFTPDVPFPEGELTPDQYIFFSQLPQALSTRAEMMTRYNGNPLDGKSTCLQRVHVTGGTNGILVEALRRHQPFTPTFIGRAEDQAYILSVFPQPGSRLAYLHADGLIMRHDKETFAGEAIQLAAIGKLIGDYIRILYFSEYTRVLAEDIRTVKERVDPFTGCFISPIPRTIVYLRFALKVASLFSRGARDQGREFATIGAHRISRALDFVAGENSPLRQQYLRERRGWRVYYRLLSALEEALAAEDAFAKQQNRLAREIVIKQRLNP